MYKSNKNSILSDIRKYIILVCIGKNEGLNTLLTLLKTGSLRISLYKSLLLLNIKTKGATISYI